MNSSKIVINCSTNFSSLRISRYEDPSKGSPFNAEPVVNANVQKTLIEYVPEIAQYFFLEGQIGEGTFSKVLKARLIKDKTKQFALKYIIPTVKSSRIATELRYLRDLGGNSNIIQVHAAIARHGHTAIIMPYFPHDDFSQYVSDLTVEEIQDFMKNLLIALAKVHSNGVIHRDIKPKNFLYNRADRTYVLVDFGLAQNERDLVRLSKSLGQASKVKSAIAELTQAAKNNFKVLEKAERKTAKLPAAYFKAVVQNKKRVNQSSQPTRKKVRLNDGSQETSVFNTPLTPNDMVISKRDNENNGNCYITQSTFITPTKSTKTPNQSATAIPETPPRTAEAPKKLLVVARASNKQTVLNCALSETPKSRLQDRQHFAELKCNCFAKAQVCRICTKKTDICAPRAGTPGYRAPEVLLRSMEQTTAIDMWSAGVIFASLLSGRYPFFRNADDMTTLAEIITVLGLKRVAKVARRLGRSLTISSAEREPLDLKMLCTKLRPEGTELDLPDSAFDLLSRMLDPNPWTRIRAEEGLKHEFFICRQESEAEDEEMLELSEGQILEVIEDESNSLSETNAADAAFIAHIQTKFKNLTSSIAAN